MNRYIEYRIRLETLWQGHGCLTLPNRCRKPCRSLAIKVAMLPHVGAKPRCASLQGNLPHHTAFHKGSQAIIDCRHRYLRHLLLRPNKNLLRRRMIPLFDQHVVYLLALRRKSKAAVANRSFRGLSLFSLQSPPLTLQIYPSAGLVNIWNNSKSQFVANLVSDDCHQP